MKLRGEVQPRVKRSNSRSSPARQRDGGVGRYDPSSIDGGEDPQSHISQGHTIQDVSRDERRGLTAAELELVHDAFLEIYGGGVGTRNFYKWMSSKGGHAD